MPHSHDHQSSGQAEMLDLDAQLFAPAMLAALDQSIRSRAEPVRSIVDLGAGTGAHTFQLLRHLPAAHAVAVDASPQMLERLDSQAHHLGLADRVTTRLADLDAAVPPVGPADLVWASASLHHLADPVRTLAEIATIIGPDGLIAVTELDGLPRFLPGGVPGAAVERVAHAVLTADRAAHMPTMGSDWGPRLFDAGLSIEAHHTITADATPANRHLIGTYAATTLTMIRRGLTGRLRPEDLDALDSLVDGGAHDVRNRDDLQVIGQRSMWIASRRALPA